MDDQDTLGFAVYRPPVFSLPGGLVDKGTLLSIAPYSGPAPAGKSYPTGTVYYTTDGTDPRPPGFGAPVPTDIPVVPEYSLASYHIPTAGNGGAAATIADWTGPVLGPTAAGLPWLTGRLALGFDDNTSSNYVHIGGGDYAQGDIRAGMLGVSSTVFIRIPFTLDATQMQRLTAMTLKMRQDDAFIAFLHGGVLTENDRADLVFLEVQCQADRAVAEVEHLVEHRVGEAFDLGHAVGDFTDDADVLPGHGRLEAGDLRFDFLEDAAHRINGS